MSKNIFEEDQHLEKMISKEKGEKPNFDWSELFEEESAKVPYVVVVKDGEEENFNLGEIATTIGDALTDLLLSKKEEDIFNEQNKTFVLNVVKLVSEKLASKIKNEKSLKLTKREVSLLVEKVLIERNAHDVAKSLVFKRSLSTSSRINDFSGKMKLIRRNGQVVPWNERKIESAVRKAFLSVQMDSGPAVEISKSVTKMVIERAQEFIQIENVQDYVQQELMRQGHYKVAEAYILYRAERRFARTSPQQTKDEQSALISVKRDDGSTFFWDGEDLRQRIKFSLIGLNLIMSENELEKELRRSVFSDISMEDLKKTIILNAKALIEKDSGFNKFAGRILLTYIYEEVLGWDIVKDGVSQLKKFHEIAFKRNLKRSIEIERVNPELLKYDLAKLASFIDPSSDLGFDYLGIQTLYDRYLIVDKTGGTQKRLECPQLFWMRVSMGLFLEDKNREKNVVQLYKMYKSRRFCSSTPTLFNSGTLHSQLSSCYLYKVDDDLKSIMERGIAENAYLSKWAGGLGGSWTSVRGMGAYIKGTNGESQGVIPFLKLHNDQLVAVNQGGKRKGSGCAYLESWHSDVFDFLDLRKNTGDERRRTHDLNTANWIPDLFMKRMEKREDWTLFHSNEVPKLHDLYGADFEKKYLESEELAKEGKIYSEKVPALDLWKKMLTMLFETGHPWITFKDACNVRNPQDHTGVIHSSNLCTEITLNTGFDETAVCNLGSIVLENHLDSNGKLDRKKLKETVTIAIRALDNVIDINFYPTDPASNSNNRHRPIGLGVMGLQNSLYIKDVPFDSQDAIDFNDEFMEAIAYYAYEASSDLADERGSYSTFKGSKWDRGILPFDSLDLLEKERGMKIDVPRGKTMKWDSLKKKIQKQGMRNSNVIAIAPTATISNIMGSSPCIEPTYKNLFVKSNLSGEFISLNQFLVDDLKKLKLWDQEMLDQLKYFDGELEDIAEIPKDVKDKYKTAFSIEYGYLIDAAARRQKWIDQSQSVNLFLAKPELKTLSHMYRRAWHTGLKTTYYLRTLAASNIEKATINVEKEVRGVVSEDKGAASQSACSIDAWMNGEECESCQ